MKSKNKIPYNLKKNDRGITLIALVVTIIVLLILAAVAINLTIGNNGIFTRAQNATQKWEEASNNESKQLDGVVNVIDNLFDTNNNVIGVKLQNSYIEDFELLQIEIDTDTIPEEEIEKAKEKRILSIEKMSVEEKENEVFKFYCKLFNILGESIKTEQELLEIMKKLDPTLAEVQTFKEVLEKMWKDANDGTSYEEFIKNELNGLIQDQKLAGILNVKITKPNGEEVEIILENDTIGGFMIQEYGTYKVDVELYGSKLKGTASININLEKNYKVDYLYLTKAYLLDNDTGKYVTITNAYVYIDDRKIDVSKYIKSDGDYFYLDVISLYYDNMTEGIIPFEIELVNNKNGAKLTITEKPVS